MSSEYSATDMEADSPPTADKRLNDSCEETEADSTIHGFNISNITVIEKEPARGHCEGSDSGVEVLEAGENTYRRALSSTSANSQEFDTCIIQSCDSSIISCCSNYDDAYNLLVRRNSTLLEDYALRNGDVTSENGSESSSISGGTSCNRRLVNGAKKKVSVAESKTKATLAKERPRTKPPVTPKAVGVPIRLKSIDRVQGKGTPVVKIARNKQQTPNHLDLTGSSKKEAKRAARASSSSRTPIVTPTDDGRWPSINSKPAPLMSRSLRGALEAPKTKISQTETKTIEKYATLPRRKKEKCEDGQSKEVKKPITSRDSSASRLSMVKRSSRDSTPSKMTNFRIKQKTKIYHEFSIQTALTMADIEDALNGVCVQKDVTEVERCDGQVQVDMRAKDVEKLQAELRSLTEKYNTLNENYAVQSAKLKKTEEKLKVETVEKESLKEELHKNSQRVLAILGQDNDEGEAATCDSLIVLENEFQNVGKVVIKQEEEIAKLNDFCRSLQRDLEKSLISQKALLQQQKDLEIEGIEMQDFLQAEKATYSEALKEAETEIRKSHLLITQKDNEIHEKLEECKHLVRLSEQRRQENLGLQAKLGVLEAKSRELLVHQGSSVSGATVALSALIGRLDGLVEELVIAYNISDRELEDVIFHNEAYNNSSSSPESTPEKCRKFLADKSPSPKSGSSFVSAVINAIKNAAAQTPFAHREISKDNLSNEHSSSNEMLDSETEPCLMMEPVLEDVVIPDGHSHNMISSGHSMLSSRLTHSESLKDLSQAILNRQMSEQASLSYAGSMHTSFTTGELASLGELFPSISLVDQVIDVDNLITRLLKVIRIIQMENDDCMNELQEQRDSLLEQVDKQKETNKVVVKQLKDWEVLGARLKTEVKELMAQLSRKNTEMDNIKTELNHQREQVEKLNQDVCELSTALAKAELEMKLKEEMVGEEIKRWDKTGEMPTADVLSRLVMSQNEVPVLREKLAEKERRLSELAQEFIASKQVLTESLKDAMHEAKKQYDAIDNALEVMHSIQSVVQQCPPLSKLQRELEETSFQSASMMPLIAPPDCNANAALLQAVANIEMATTINTTA